MIVLQVLAFLVGCVLAVGLLALRLHINAIVWHRLSRPNARRAARQAEGFRRRNPDLFR